MDQIYEYILGAKVSFSVHGAHYSSFRYLQRSENRADVSQQAAEEKLEAEKDKVHGAPQ